MTPSEARQTSEARQSKEARQTGDKPQHSATSRRSHFASSPRSSRSQPAATPRLGIHLVPRPVRLLAAPGGAAASQFNALATLRGPIRVDRMQRDYRHAPSPLRRLTRRLRRALRTLLYT